LRTQHHLSEIRLSNCTLVLELRSNMAGVAARLTWRGFTDLTADTESCVQLVSRAGIIPIERTCGKCGREMH
jgi:hypothetical protein